MFLKSISRLMPTKQWIVWLYLFLALSVAGMLHSCASPGQSAKENQFTLAKELTFYDRMNATPASVLEAFSAEYGVKVNYITYKTQEEAVDYIKAGNEFDVAVINSDFIPSLIAENLLAEIDHSKVSNFQHVSLNFRGLVYDPENRYSVPHTWGTTGLLVRSDLVEGSITRWADLWDQRYAGKIGVRAQPTELISISLKALGYPLNSEDPRELETALDNLIKLKPSIVFLDAEPDKSIDKLIQGEIVIMIGWAEDGSAAHRQNPSITYILPEEGTILWSNNFVISAKSSKKYTAETFINYLLRPEINAQIINEKAYATVNEGAREFIQPEILNDPIVFPPIENLVTGEWYLPRSPTAEKFYTDIWNRFLEYVP
jgi:spermidine/putrescine transport system substrate-binding protein